MRGLIAYADQLDKVTFHADDESRRLKGKLTLTLETKSGKVLAGAYQSVNLAELGAATQKLTLTIPNAADDCVLKAVARAEGQSAIAATVSRRWVATIG